MTRFDLSHLTSSFFPFPTRSTSRHNAGITHLIRISSWSVVAAGVNRRVTFAAAATHRSHLSLIPLRFSSSTSFLLLFFHSRPTSTDNGIASSPSSQTFPDVFIVGHSSFSSAVVRERLLPIVRENRGGNLFEGNASVIRLRSSWRFARVDTHRPTICSRCPWYSRSRL